MKEHPKKRSIITKKQNSPILKHQADIISTELLNATTIGRRLEMTARQMNRALSELGLIEEIEEGWTLTKLGRDFGGHKFSGNNSKTGKPYTYVKWEEKIMENPIFIDEVYNFKNPVLALKKSDSKFEEKKRFDIRSKEDAGNFRTRDGHQVRSKAELAIDNWLYEESIVHAYERKLPIEEEVYCDFYIPLGKKVYIEYWGYDDNPRYLDRKSAKQEIYKKYNFNLIELTDQHIELLDDHLPKMLRDFGIRID